MHDERAVRVALAFAGASSQAPQQRMCATCLDLLHVSGVGITLMSGTNSGPVCSTDGRVAELEELQFTLGEGPGLDAHRGGVIIAEPQLDVEPGGRWPTFTPLAVHSGTRGVFAFPLATGDSRIGVLTLYQDTPGDLTPEQSADGQVVSSFVTELLLTLQSAAATTSLADTLSDHDAHRAEVHQASGMLAVQLGISVADALLRLRAHAYASSRPATEVALDIVERRLRLPDDSVPDGDQR
jgi:ANTAR domain